jgi:hypothetical protein
MKLLQKPIRHSLLGPSKHRVTIGLCLSRYHPTLGHPKSVTRQTAFDFNELQDRDYKYVSSTDDNGWRAGGGEPGTSKTYDDDLNSALSYTSPNSPGGHSITSHVKDTTGGGSKIPSPDTVHIPIIEIDAQSEAHVQLIIHALAKGEIFIPHMSIMPEALGVIGASSPDLVVRFGCERNEDFPIEEWPNWCLEFMHNQLYDYFQPLGAIWNKRPFQITLAKKVKWKTVKHMNNYFSRCEMVINAWREKGPQYLDPELSHFDGGASPEEIARSHGIYLMRNGTPTNYFAPNFDPPYTTKMTRSLLMNVVNKSWDKVRRDWASEPLGKLTSTNAVISRLFGCADPTVLTTHSDKSVIFTAVPKEQPEKRRIKQTIAGAPVDNSASVSEDTNVSARSSSSKISSKSLLDDCIDGDSPDKKPEQPQQQYENSINTVSATLPMDNGKPVELEKNVTRSKSESSSTSHKSHAEPVDWSSSETEKVMAISKSELSSIGKGGPSSVANSTFSRSINTASSKRFEQVEENSLSKNVRLKKTSSVAESAVSSRFDDADEHSVSKAIRSKKAASIVGSAAVSSRFDDAEEVSVPRENRSKKTSSIVGSAFSAATQKSTNQLFELDKATLSNETLSRKESDAESFGSKVRQKSFGEKLETEEAYRSKERRSTKASSTTGSTASSGSLKSSIRIDAAEEVSAFKETPSSKLTSGEGSSVSLVTKRDSFSEFEDVKETSSSISRSSKVSSVAGNGVSSSSLKTLGKFVKSEEVSVSKDIASKNGSSAVGRSRSVSNSSRASARLLKTLKSRAQSKERKDRTESGDDFGFESMNSDDSFADNFFSSSIEENKSSNHIMTPLKGITGDTSLDTAKSTPLIDNKKRTSSRFAKIRQERLGWTVKRDELAEKKDLTSLYAKLNVQHSISDKTISSLKDQTSFHGKENSLKYKKQAKVSDVSKLPHAIILNKRLYFSLY